MATKAELIAELAAKKAAVKESAVTEAASKSVLDGDVMNVTNADDTAGNPKIIPNGTVIDDGKTNNLPGVNGGQLPTQAAVEKAVNQDVGPMIPADSDGVSKNGGEDDKLMSPGGVEAERKKQDNSAKDVINVSSRKVEEASEVQNELLAQLQEKDAMVEGLQAQMAEFNVKFKAAMAEQAEHLTAAHAKEMNTIFENVIAEGEKMEKELSESVAKNERSYKTAQKLFENSNKLNKILLEAVKKAQPEVTMTRYITPARRAVESLKK